MPRRLLTWIHLHLSCLLLLSSTLVTAMPLRGMVYDNDIEEIIEGHDFAESSKLIKKLNVADDVKQIYLKNNSI